MKKNKHANDMSEELAFVENAEATVAEDQFATADAAEPTVSEAEPTEDAEKLAKFKQAKAEAAQRFKERRAAEKEELLKKSAEIIEELKAGNAWDILSESSRTFLTGLATGKAASNNNNTFNVIFGASPKVGDTVTLAEVFNKTLKGKSNIDFYCRKWLEKGIVVEFKQNFDNILDSVYEITKM